MGREVIRHKSVDNTDEVWQNVGLRLNINVYAGGAQSFTREGFWSPPRCRGYGEEAGGGVILGNEESGCLPRVRICSTKGIRESTRMDRDNLRACPPPRLTEAPGSENKGSTTFSACFITLSKHATCAKVASEPNIESILYWANP